MVHFMNVVLNSLLPTGRFFGQIAQEWLISWRIINNWFWPFMWIAYVKWPNLAKLFCILAKIRFFDDDDEMLKINKNCCAWAAAHFVIIKINYSLTKQFMGSTVVSKFWLLMIKTQVQFTIPTELNYLAWSNFGRTCAENLSTTLTTYQ